MRLPTLIEMAVFGSQAYSPARSKRIESAVSALAGSPNDGSFSV